MKKWHLYPVFLTLILVLAGGCDNSIDDITLPPGNGGTLTAIIDGQSFSVSGLLVSAEYQEIGTTVSSLFVGGATLPLGSSTEALVLAMVRTDSTAISSGDVFVGSDMTRLAAGEYTLDAATVSVSALSANASFASMTVTSLDFTTGLVSGTFSFDAVDDNDPTKVYEVRDGVFTNIPLD